MSAEPVVVPARARYAVLLVFTVHSLLFASWTAHIPLVKADLGLSDADLGLALLGAPLGSVAATVATGYLLPRVGSRRMVAGTLVGYCLTGAGLGLAPTPVALFVALAVWGAFQGALDVSMNTQAVTVEQALGKPIMSGLHGGWSVGGLAGSLLGAGLVAAGVTLSVQFIVLGPVLLVLAGVASTRLLADPAVDASSDGGGDAPSVWRRPVLLVLGGTALASMLAEGAAADWSAVHLRDGLGAGPAVAGLGYAAFSATMLTVRLLGDWLLARIDARVLLPALALVSLVGSAVGVLSDSPAVAIAGFAALGIGLALVVPAMFSAAGRLPGLRPGQAIATVSALGWVGFVAGPPAIGHLAAVTGLGKALLVLPVLAALIALGARSRAVR